MLSIIVISDSKSNELLATLNSIALCLENKNNDPKYFEVVIWIYDPEISLSEINEETHKSVFLKGFLEKKIYCKSKIIKDKDSGIYDAQFRAAKNAEMENLLFINSGDFLDPSFNLNNFRDIISNKNNFWVHGGHKILTKTKIFSKKISFSPPLISFCHQSIIFKKDLFFKCANNRELKSAGDLKLVINCMDLVGKPIIIPEPLSIRDKRYEGEGSSMLNATEAFNIINKRYGFISSLPWLIPILKGLIKKYLWIKK